MQGLIHIYTGDGKGKTTTSVGLCIRFIGNGGTVLYAQFLKNDTSSELNILSQLEKVTFVPSGQSFGFSFQMTPEQKEQARLHYTEYFTSVIRMLEGNHYGLLVLDEIIGADRLGFVPHDLLLDFLKNKPKELEVVMTGREPGEDLTELADYVSEIQCRKHPFQCGIPARKGIEK